MIRTAVFETLCLVGGVAGFLLTDNWVWIVIGLVAGLGFSLPTIVKLIRARRGDGHAPR